MIAQGLAGRVICCAIFFRFPPPTLLKARYTVPMLVLLRRVKRISLSSSFTNASSLSFSAASMAIGLPAQPAKLSLMYCRPNSYTSSAFGKKSRHTRVAAASSGRPRPKASMTYQLS